MFKRVVLLLLIFLYAGAISAFDIAYSADSSKKITNREEAMERAWQLKLLPDEAVVTAERKRTSNSDTWTLTFSPNDKSNRSLPEGFITLDSTSAEVLRFYSVTKNPNHQDELFDVNKEKVSKNDAIIIAEQFMKKQEWQLPAEWIIDPYEEGYYWYNYEDNSAHKIRFNLGQSGIRLKHPNLNFTIFVDRITGKVTSHRIEWQKQHFPERDEGIISTEEAGRLFYEQVKPILTYSENTSTEMLQYQMERTYTMDARTGKLNDSSRPAFTGSKNDLYSEEAAKRRLLSNYALELQYDSNLNFVYRLEILPQVIDWYLGIPHIINAKTGEWRTFDGESVQLPLPEPGEWLVNSAAADKISYAAAIVLNRELLSMTDEPIIANGSVLIPFRRLMEKMGAAVSWDQTTKKVIAQTAGKKIELVMNSQTAIVNGAKYHLNAPAQLVNGRTYIPVRFVSEALGAEVSWDSSRRLVVIQSDPTLQRLTETERNTFQFKAQLNWEEKKQSIKSK